MSLGRKTCRACHGAGCPACHDLAAQAADWLALKCPPSISGSGGHGAAFAAACCLVKGFDFSPDRALPVFQGWNAGCQPPWSPSEIAHKLASAHAAPDKDPRGYLIWNGRAATPQEGGSLPPASATVGGAPIPANAARMAALPVPGKALPFDPAALRAAVRTDLTIDHRWLRARSPVDPASVTTPEAFLAHIFQPGERILVFTKYRSQGQYIAVPAAAVPQGGIGVPPACALANAAPANSACKAYRLADRPGRSAAPVPCLPTGRESEAMDGIWFLNQPVSGQWLPNPRSTDPKTGKPKLSRRSEESVTRWPYFVLESDEPGIEADWLRLMVDLPLAITALYTSGGRSVHALIRVDAPSKPHWDAFCTRALRPVLTRLGADPGVFTAIRLTRLPVAWRRGSRADDGRWLPYDQPRLQKLLYLNPHAQPGQSILSLPPARLVESTPSRCCATPPSCSGCPWNGSAESCATRWPGEPLPPQNPDI